MPLRSGFRLHSSLACATLPPSGPDIRTSVGGARARGTALHCLSTSRKQVGTNFGLGSRVEGLGSRV
eukprot:3217297-Rhodomonas_salina.1